MNQQFSTPYGFSLALVSSAPYKSTKDIGIHLIRHAHRVASFLVGSVTFCRLPAVCL
ncbi:hypothetical protein HanXRQr2_Chr12g0539111 [Helianthus annuus]|uniref:Uncharacterized protein n=1 Tax=Helianthus annuus TaxID=4232 RepID=A0A9K3MVW0_HELAN|nr:hypothetical protein HanXRQr2_Chr12g0539111 [Helianthus annuus]KAJ0862498.1 hypothetical protein HanPSC8_Chr12g0518921 [Helianthus annuus]